MTATTTVKRFRHPPPRLASSRTTDVYISVKTPFLAALKRIDRSLDRTKAKRLGRYVRVLGTGKAMQKVLSVAMELKARKQYKVELRTKTLETFDEFIDEAEGTADMKKRHVAAVELHVYRLTDNN